MAAKLGEGDERSERLAVGQQARADRRRRHRGERIEQHAGEARAPERRLEPARTDEMRELGADFVARGRFGHVFEILFGSARRHPCERERPHLRIARRGRSEEHTSELQSLMRISYAVFCLKKTKLTKFTNVQINSN